MAFLGSIFIAALALFLGTFVLQSLRTFLAYESLRRRVSAEEPPTYRHKDPFFGLDLFLGYKRAFSEGRFLELNRRHFEFYGKTWKANKLGTTIIKTIDPEISKAFHATHFEEFGLEPLRYENGKRLFGNGILVVDGPKWAHGRALIRPSFETVHIANFQRLKPHTDNFMKLLPRDCSTIDLLPLLRLLILDTSSEFIFGEPMGALSSSKTSEDITNSFAYAQRGIGIRTELGRLRFLHFDKQWTMSCDKVHAFCDAHVMKAVERMQSGKPATTNKGRLRLVDEMAKDTQDLLDLRHQILSVFSPGHDSTAVALGNTFFHLARHPETYQKLRDEILPTKDMPLTFDLVRSYKFLEFVLKETQRLTPLATMNQRQCLKTTVLPCGGGKDGRVPLVIQKGEILEVHYRLMMRDKSIWGLDADEFKPERWADARPAWSYTPFGGGPRTCPAQRLLFTEAAYIAVRILRDVKNIENRDETWEWQEEMRLTFQSKNGVKVGLTWDEPDDSFQPSK
ncbi:MAG: hypothetical protein M1820_008031 [Bogoriella megaspora]|nr:MAG: hypothetical protein M1820_008031 [Bogoriella megaspora]